MLSLAHIRDRLRSSLWFIPAVLVTIAVTAALLLASADSSLARYPGFLRLQIQFTGGPESARAILGAIAGSMLTLTGLVFSITILVLQLASSQFSPRTLRSFLRDRPSKFALGIFLSTFAFALVGLRAVRTAGPEREEFVPGLVVSGAFLLVMGSIAMLVYYIHHVSQRIRITSITSSVVAETDEVIGRLYAEDAPLHGPVAVPTGQARDVPSPRDGYVVNLDLGRLVERAGEADSVLELAVPVGSYVPCGAPLLRVRGGRISGTDEDGLEDLVAIDDERTMEQDVAYGLRQLVDIALRALSPGVNDPSTAVDVVHRLHGLLRRAGSSPAPTGYAYDEGGDLRLIVPVPDFAELVGLAVTEIAHYGADAPTVRNALTGMLRELEGAVREENRPFVTEALREAEETMAVPRFRLPVPG